MKPASEYIGVVAGEFRESMARNGMTPESLALAEDGAHANTIRRFVQRGQNVSLLTLERLAASMGMRLIVTLEDAP